MKNFVLFSEDGLGLLFWNSYRDETGRVSKAKKYTRRQAENLASRVKSKNLKYATLEEVLHYQKSGIWEAV